MWEKNPNFMLIAGIYWSLQSMLGVIRIQDWNKPIIVLLHPINADGRSNTQNYINTLNINNLNSAQDYLKQASLQYRGQPIALYFKQGRRIKAVATESA